MKLCRSRTAKQRGDSGQTLLLFIFSMIVLILLLGLGIDLGFAYVTKANLSKAVDAAGLAGMMNLSQGTITAGAIASSTFKANYGSPGRDAVGSPALNSPTITWTVDSANNKQINVDATATINTFFIRILPQWKTLSVSAHAQATRAPLIMTLVLDRSGSMGSDPPSGSGGGRYLPRAVRAFINDFDDATDKAAMVSFSTVQNNVVYGGSPPQPIQPFKSQIINAVNAFTWSGATFAQGGLTNALVLENNAYVPPNENFVKVVVFFTDGYANTIQDALDCPPATLYNFGGNAPTENAYIGFFDPNTGATRCGSTASRPDTPVAMSGCSCSAAGFRSAIDGTTKSFTRANITADGEYRSIQVANAMRAQHIIVYSIGEGTDVNLTFLQEVANDPSLAGTPGYAATPYDGEAMIANDPTELEQVFEQIAAKILLRLTQ